jgi:hypothetical protein
MDSWQDFFLGIIVDIDYEIDIWIRDGASSKSCMYCQGKLIRYGIVCKNGANLPRRTNPKR